MPAPRKIEFARRVHELYSSGLSSREVGAIVGLSSAGVCNLLKRHGFPRRPRPTAAAIVVYKGDRYAPDKDGGLRATNATVRKDPARFYLFRRVWIEHHGPIPEGHTIVPKNGDKSDFRIENLECLWKGECVRRLGGRGNGHTKGYILATYPEKCCVQCGAKMTPHEYGTKRESPAYFIKRKTCGFECSRAYLKGKPRGSTVGQDAATWRDYAKKVAPPKGTKKERAAAVIKRKQPQLPQDHMGLVFQAAANLARKLECHTDELLGDAYLSMVEAARTFKPEKGFRFSTHATTALKFRLYTATMQDRGKRRIRKDGNLEAWRDPLGLKFMSGSQDGEVNSLEAGNIPGMVGGVYECDPLEGEERTLAEERARTLGQKSRRLSDLAEDVLQFVGRGLNQTQIAAALGMSRQRISQVVEEIRESKACRKAVAGEESAA